jgi:hypothetical protein
MNFAYNQRFRHLGTDFSELFWRELEIELVPEVWEYRTRDCAPREVCSATISLKSSPDVPKEIYPNNYRYCRERLFGARAKPAELLR